MNLRIAITVDPEIPVPPRYYGGIERIVDTLVRGLISRGHEVMLFGHPDSSVPCTMRPYPGQRSRNARDLLRNIWHTSSSLMRDIPDVVHSFGRLAYLLPVMPLKLQKIMSYQRIITPRSVAWGEKVARKGTLHFTGCSAHLIRAYAGRQNWHVVYNAAEARKYSASFEISETLP